MSERGVLVRKEIAVESGRACATDRGSGGLGLAEGIVFRAVLSRRLSEDKYEHEVHRNSYRTRVSLQQDTHWIFL